MTEGELKQLEAAYKNDVSLEQVKQALIDGGQEQGIPQVEDFYKKKKTLESKIQSQPRSIHTHCPTCQCRSQPNNSPITLKSRLKRILRWLRGME